MKVNYGTKGLIGVINISSTVNLEPELNAMTPWGVAILTDRVDLYRTTPEALAELADQAGAAAARLATAKPDVIVFACTSGSFINGQGYDQEVRKKLEQFTKGIPVITTATAILAALNALHIQKFSLGTPYLPEVNQRAKNYFVANGYQILKMAGLGLDRDYLIGEQTEETVKNLAARVNTPPAEAIVLSCTNLKTIAILEELEADLKKPIISANQASLWWALRTIGIQEPVPGLGSLFCC